MVKGGRLGLMPGVLFHSCRPSFRYTGIMFLEFAFLTRSGDLWDPLDSFALNKTPPARPNLGFTICHLSLFPPGFLEPEGHLYFKPPDQCSFECWPKPSDVRRPLATRVYANPTSCPSSVP